MGLEIELSKIKNAGIDVSPADNENLKISNQNAEEPNKSTELEHSLKISHLFPKLLKANESNVEIAEKEIEKKRSFIQDFLLGEGTVISAWKNIENFSSRVVDINEESVILECLLDKDNRIYEEREFDISDFDNFLLHTGKLFKLCWYRRNNQIMMEIKDNPQLISDDDFPESNFVSKFNHIKLKK